MYPAIVRALLIPSHDGNEEGRCLSPHHHLLEQREERGGNRPKRGGPQDEHGPSGGPAWFHTPKLLEQSLDLLEFMIPIMFKERFFQLLPPRLFYGQQSQWAVSKCLANPK